MSDHSPTLDIMSIPTRRQVVTGMGAEAALSLFATTHSVSESAGSAASSSVPHTPPSATLANLTRSFDHYDFTPYQYSQPKDQGRGEQEDEDGEEEEDEIVLSYPSITTRIIPRRAQSDLHSFSAQRSKILKINALAPGDGPAVTATTTALLHPSHYPRSLWTLAEYQQGQEPYVWAIFDTHEHALSAFHTLRTSVGVPSTPLVEPALESALHPFSKLRKVDMKTWSARWRHHHQQRGEGEYTNAASTYSFVQHYGRQASEPPTCSSPSPSREHEQEQETVTPVPPHTLPEQGQGQQEREDHSTPIPPSHPPAAISPVPNHSRSTEMNSRNTIDIDGVDGGAGRGGRRRLFGGERILGAGRATDVSDGGVGVVPVGEQASVVAAGGGSEKPSQEQAPMLDQLGTAHQQQGEEHSSRLLTLDQHQHQHPPPGVLAPEEEEDHHLKSSSSPSSFELPSSPPRTFACTTTTATTTTSSSSSAPFDLSTSFGSSFASDHPPSTSSVVMVIPHPHPHQDHSHSHQHNVLGEGEAGAGQDEGVKTMTHQSLTAISASSVAGGDSIEKQGWTATAGGTLKLKGHNPNHPPAAKTSMPYNGVDQDPVLLLVAAADQMGDSSTSSSFSFANPSSYPAVPAGPDHNFDHGNDRNEDRSSRANASGVVGRVFSPMLDAPHPHPQQQPHPHPHFHFQPELLPLPRSGERNDEARGAGARLVDFDETARARARADEVQSFNIHPPHQRSPPQYPTQGYQQDLQKQVFLHDQPHRSSSLSFFHQEEQNNHQNRNHQHQLLQQQQQRQHQNQYQQHHQYPLPPTVHANIGPAPSNVFRHGDWLCNMPGCGAHNFGRNVACIMCGFGRATVSGAAAFGLSRAQAAQAGPGSGMSMGMGMSSDAELDNDYSYELERLRLQASGNTRTGNMSIGQAHAHGQASTYIPVIPPRYAGIQHEERRAPPPHMSTPGDLAMNNTLVQALGGISEVAAIQEAIKAHQSQMQSQESRGNMAAAATGLLSGNGQRRARGDVPFSVPGQHGGVGGQLLIPTTLGNSPPVPPSQGPIIVQQGRGGARLGARNGSMGDVQGRNQDMGLQHATLMHHRGLSPMASQFSPQVQGMQQNYQMQHGHAMPPSLLGAVSPATAAAAVAVATAAIPPSKIPGILTPSGRKFASGGRVQNISRDELNPIVMFWPENEPLPLPSQVRPPAAILMALGGVQGPPPPILNTGNKGPIDAQPGDWTCGKCDYLNWRRRRVCANCFPHAEGNTEGTKHSTNDVQERVALLASVILQQQQQVQAQQQQIQSQHVTAAAFASNPNQSSTERPGFGFGMNGLVPHHQQQSYVEPPRRSDSLPLSNAEHMHMHLLAHKYGHAAPAPNGLRPEHSFDSPLPLNLPPRMIHPSASDGTISRTFFDSLNRNAPSFQPLRVATQFDGAPHRLRSSPPTSSRSSVSLSSNGSFFKNSNEHTPSPLPLLPAFLHEVVGEPSESSSSSVHESPSPPSPASASSAFGSINAGASRVNELVGTGLRRREHTSPASGLPQMSNNIHRTASHSSIWTLGYPGDRKEDGVRHV